MGAGAAYGAMVGASVHHGRRCGAPAPKLLLEAWEKMLSIVAAEPGAQKVSKYCLYYARMGRAGRLGRLKPTSGGWGGRR